MKRVLMAALLLMAGLCGYAQLKIGSNPSQINKSSILELESTRQGLLLPRVPGANLTTAPLSTAPDGMIVYVTDSTSLFIRESGSWQRINVSSGDIAHTLFATTTDSTGMTISGTTLILHAADATHPGGVDTIAQTFGGNKTFNGNVTAAQNATVSGNLYVGTASGTSTFQLNGSMASNITKVTASYTATAADNTVLADATTGALTITLPSPGSITGRIYTIKKIGTGGIDNALTITPSTGTIDGGSNFIIYNDWSFVSLQTDGTNWYVIKK